MSDRRAELERKKAKLQALREEKDRRRREKELKDVEEAASRASGATNRDTSQRQIDEMLSSLGVAPVSDVLSSLSSMSSLDNTVTEENSQSNTQTPTPTTYSKRRPQLSIAEVGGMEILPKEVVVYTKQTQTLQSGPERDVHAADYYDEYNLNPGLEWEDEFTVLTFDDAQAEDEDSSSLPHIDGFASKLPPGIIPHGLPQVKEVQPAVTAVEQAQVKQEEKKVRELSEEEKQMIILSEDFQKFMDRAGRIIERALAEGVDIYTDYTGASDIEDNSDEKSHQRLSLNRCFLDERWSKNRCITSMDWSTHYPELLLASYHKNQLSPNDPDGVCLIWNTKFKKTTPEFVFHCQSPVMSAVFAKFHPNLVLGGTYSGQIVLWDNRVQKRTPIQRTPLSASAHTHPVYCMNVIGTQNAHNLISISTDGKMCSWSLDMLSQPQEVLDLHRQQSKPIAVTSLAFPHSDVNNFVVGSEEGVAYSACRHGTKAGVTDTYESHQGPITGVSCNAVQGGIDFSHLFLTSSIDWTVKLWTLKESKPIYSFEDNNDYVLDVAWSPIHPALFACVDGMGKLDLWQLNQDTEVPSASVVVDGQRPLNRVSWTPSGLHVTVGDDSGKIWIYDVAEQFAHPRHDDWNKFMYTTQEFRYAQHDDELERLKFDTSSVGSCGYQSMASTVNQSPYSSMTPSLLMTSPPSLR